MPMWTCPPLCEAFVLNPSRVPLLWPCFRLGLSTHNSKLFYADFLRAFEEGRKDHYWEEQVEPGFPRQFPNMEADKAEEKMTAKIAEQADIILSVGCSGNIVYD